MPFILTLHPRRTHQDYSMYSANVSLARLFFDGLNTRNPDLTDVQNPGEKIVTLKSPGEGVHAFATPTHMTMARALLGGCIGFVVAAFFLIPAVFRDNYDPTWEKGEQWAQGQ